jgi:hypothetical protein
LKDYLGTILDPLLRRMMIVNDLSMDVCQELGGMRAVEDLLTFEELNARLQSYCNALNSTDASSRLPSMSSKAVRYSVAHCSRKQVELSSQVWSEWWCGQEKPRIRKIMDDYIRLHPGRGRSSSGLDNIPPSSRSRLREIPSSDGGSMSYIIDVIEGVKKGAIEKAQQRKVPIEVGVFVIQKDVVDDAGTINV